MQSIYKAEPVKVVVCMVGLPARGKSYISKKIYRFLNWLGFKTQVFNVGNYRRKYMKDHDLLLSSEFFDPSNRKCYELRQMIAHRCLQDLISFMNHEDNRVAIFDGTNTKSSRRRYIADELKAKLDCRYQLIMIESVCDKEEIVDDNIKNVKVNGRDYEDTPMEEAVTDFKRRIANYEKVYEPLSKDEGFPFIRVINVGEGVEINQIKGYLPQKIMTYTINLTISPKRTIYLSRHGESMYNIEGRIGGNSELSERGEQYAKALPTALEELVEPDERREFTILTSTLARTIDTARHIRLNEKEPIELRVLDEINAGICEHLTYKQMLEKHPEIYKQREMEKLYYRYPSGESYIDVIGRLEPLIYWIERQKHSVLVVSHQAVIRCIYAYFFNIELNELPHMDVPLHRLIRLTPEDYTFKEDYVHLCQETGRVLEIKQERKRKFSINLDGSERKQTKKFKKTISELTHKTSTNSN